MALSMILVSTSAVHLKSNTAKASVSCICKDNPFSEALAVYCSTTLSSSGCSAAGWGESEMIPFSSLESFTRESIRNRSFSDCLCSASTFAFADSGRVSSIKRVAVVVSPSIEQVRQIEAAGFDYVQIHGEIPETEAEAAKAIPILKAFNVSDMDSYEKYHNDSRIAGYVFDAIEPGSGKTFDWKLVDNIPRDEKLLLLAGGLNPDNVRMAIEAVHPDGVDVSSGVENDDKAGKNPEKIHDFVAAIKS